MNKSILALSAAMLLTGNAMAQNQKKSTELDAWQFFCCHKGSYITFDGGMTSFKATQNVGDNGEYKSMPWVFNFGYQWYFTNHLGIGTGVSLQRVNMSDISYNGYTQVIKNATDELDRSYEHRSEFINFSETVKGISLSIPVALYAQGNISLSWKIYGAVGAKFNFFPKLKYDTDGNIKTKAYYDAYHLELSDIQGHNIYTTSNSFSDNYSDIPLTVTGFAELGLLYAVSPRFDIKANAVLTMQNSKFNNDASGLLYTPDYEINNTTYNSQYNGMLNSDVAPEISKISFGFNVGIRYRIGKEAKIEFEEFGQRRRMYEAEGMNIRSTRKLDFEEAVRRRRDSEMEDSLARERHRIEEMEVEQPQYVKDSLEKIRQDSIAQVKIKQDSIEKVRQDSIRLANEANEMLTEELKNEIEEILDVINKNNSCKFNQDTPKENKKVTNSIAQLAEIMKENPKVKVIVTGHTCDIGTKEQNEIVGMRRAEAFRELMKKYGVSESQIECRSVGYAEPTVPNTSETNRSKNRRINIKLKEK